MDLDLSALVYVLIGIIVISKLLIGNGCRYRQVGGAWS